MLLFQSEEQVDEWCAARQVTRGAVAPVAQVWRLSQAWYANRLSPDYHGRSLAEVQAIFRSVDLTSPFWAAADS